MSINAKILGMTELFHTIIYDPIYNLLIWLVSTFSWIDLGLAVVLLTILVKLALYPLAKGGSKTQEAMKIAKPELDEIKADFKKIKTPSAEDRQEMGKKTLDVYKKYGIKPFSSFATLFIQLPILLALYWIFFSGGLPEVQTNILYSFIQAPEAIRMTFLGFIDISGKSILLALFAGFVQYAHLSHSLGKIDLSKDGNKFGALGADFGKTLQVQMKYILPIIIAVIAYISSVLALYLISSSLFALLQDVVIKRGIAKGAKKIEVN